MLLNSMRPPFPHWRGVLGEQKMCSWLSLKQEELVAVHGEEGRRRISPETGRASADYIQLYHGDATLLTQSLEVIQKTSAVILSGIAAMGGARPPLLLGHNILITRVGRGFVDSCFSSNINSLTIEPKVKRVCLKLMLGGI